MSRRLPHRCCNGRGQHYSWCKIANRRAADKQAAQRRVAAEQSDTRLRIDLSDPDTRAIRETAKRARDEVASWPAWKRGEEPGAPRSGYHYPTADCEGGDRCVCSIGIEKTERVARTAEEQSWRDTWADAASERRR